MRYRPEIDGLRAVAVLPVILFHAGFSVFSGGYIGVDIFFVISGYLITTIILADMEKGSFSLLEFYERRARRILPALLFVSICCIPVAWVILMPADMQAFSRSLVAVMTFSSNILFWVESGYFDTAAELKPLLHTWSLAIEEQYYIVFPLFLMLTWRFGTRWILVLLAIAFTLSFVAADWGSFYKPNATFYLLPTRGWELLVGGFAAFYLRSSGSANFSKWVAQIMSLVGMAMILFAIFSFDADTRFPSVYTLVPCLGALFIIIFARQGTLVGSILSARILVSTGLISYSAYLWHQPIFAFVKYRLHNNLSNGLMLGLCLLVLVMAVLSWHYIEKPFRDRKRFSRETIFYLALGFSTLVSAVGLAGYLSDGYKSNWLTRQSAEVGRLYSIFEAERLKDMMVAAKPISHDNGDCRFNASALDPRVIDRILACHAKYGKGVVILGDSHATDLFGAVSVNNSEDAFLVGLTRGGCRPHTPASHCQYEDFLDLLRARPELFSKVVYEQAGFYLLRTNKRNGSRDLFAGVPLGQGIKGVYPHQEFIAAVHEYLRLVNDYVPVLWFGSRVEPHISDHDIFRLGCDFDFQLRDKQFDVFLALDAEVERVTQEVGEVDFLSQNEAFDYQFPRDFMTCEESFWTGGDHLSEGGEKHFGGRYDLLKHTEQ